MISSEDAPFDRMRIAALGGALFLLYLCIAYPTLSPYRDSGDLAAAAATLGVAHPPGYPLYALLGSLWLRMLPLGNPAYRLHILSGICGAGACAGLAAALLRVRGAGAGRSAAALLAGAMAGLSPALLRLSAVSEMYTLSLLCGAGALALCVPDAPAPSGRPSAAAARRLTAAALLLGLGCGAHQTLLSLAPGLLWMSRDIWLPGWKRRVPALAGFFLLGAAVFAYLPLRASAGPVIDWGDPQSFRNFVRMLTRADYGGVRLHPDRPSGLFSPSAWGPGLRLSWSVFAAQLGWAGSALALVGIWSDRRERTAQGLGLAFLLSGPLFIIWAGLDPARPETRPILEPHLLLPLLCLAGLAGLGARALLARGAALAGSRARWTVAAGAAALALAWAATQAPATAAARGSRGDFSAWEFGRSFLGALPRGALVVDPDDQTAFAMSYLRWGPGFRKDLFPVLYFRTRWGYEQLRRRRPELLGPAPIRSGREVLGAVLAAGFAAGRPMFVDLPQKTPPGTASVPYGLGYRLLPAGLEAAPARRAFEAALRRTRLPAVSPAGPKADFFTRHAVEFWSSSLSNLGIEAQRVGDAEAASTLYCRALTVSGDLPEAWNNWGNVAQGRGEHEAAIGRYLASIRASPAARTYYNLGRAYLGAARYGEAEAAYRRSARDGGPAEARNDLGLVFLRTGRPAEAAAQWEALLRERPDFGVAYYNLALAYEKLGRHDEARAAMETYKKL